MKQYLSKFFFENQFSENVSLMSSNSYLPVISGVVLLGLCVLVYRSPFFYMTKPLKVEKVQELDPNLLIIKYKEKARLLKNLEKIENSRNLSIEDAITKKCIFYDRIKEFEGGLSPETLQALELIEKIMGSLQ